MNLVAKEFVACQINQPPGVLIVSPFSGAGETMHESLICNPYEINEAAEVLHRFVQNCLFWYINECVRCEMQNCCAVTRQHSGK
jgi:trehalose-6-phosphate synthase